MKIEIKNLKKIVVLMFVLQYGIPYAHSQNIKSVGDSVFSYLDVDKIPVFPNGSRGLKLFTKNHLKWPDPDIDVHGYVLVSFIVKKSGNVVGIRVEKSLSKTFDEEAVRFVKRMPQWKSGELNGKKVDVKLYLPISFFQK